MFRILTKPVNASLPVCASQGETTNALQTGREHFAMRRQIRAHNGKAAGHCL
jgi:hypothetical protein